MVEASSEVLVEKGSSGVATSEAATVAAFGAKRHEGCQHQLFSQKEVRRVDTRTAILIPISKVKVALGPA